MSSRVILPAVLLLSVAPICSHRAGPPVMPRPQSGAAAAPIDMTGYWVSVVDEDWRWRMVPPAKGDYASVPMVTPGGAGRRQHVESRQR